MWVTASALAKCVRMGVLAGVPVGTSMESLVGRAWHSLASCLSWAPVQGLPPAWRGGSALSIPRVTLRGGRARGCPLPASGPSLVTKPAISGLKTGQAGSTPSPPPTTSGARRKRRRHSLRHLRPPGGAQFQLPPSPGSRRAGSGGRLAGAARRAG